MRHVIGCLLLICVGVVSTVQTSADAPQVSANQESNQDKSAFTDLDGKPLPGEVLKVLAAPAFRHDGPVYCVAAAHDGKHLVTCNEQGAFLWDAASGLRLKYFPASFATCLAAAPASNLIAIGNAYRVITVWDIATGNQRFNIDSPASDPVRALAFSPDGKRLAAVARTVRLWDMASGDSVGELVGHEGIVLGVAFHPDGKSLFTTGLDGTLRQWNSVTCKETRRLIEQPDWWMENLAITADGKSLAVLNRGDGLIQPRVRVFDISSLEQRFAAQIPGGFGLREVALSPDGRFVAVAFQYWLAEKSHGDNGLRVWDTVHCKRVVLQTNSDHVGLGLCFLDQGKTLASSGYDRVVRLWNVADGTEHKLTKNPSGAVDSLTFSPSGKRLTSINKFGVVQLWDAVDGTRLHMLGRLPGQTTALSFSADDENFLLAQLPLSADAYQKWGYLWNARSGKPNKLFDLVFGIVPVAPFVPKQPLLAVQLASSVSKPVALPALLAPNGKTIAIPDSEGGISLCDLATGKEKLSFTGPRGPVLAMAFSPSGDLLVSANSEGEIRVWRTATAMCVSSFQSRAVSVVRVYFSHDGACFFVHQNRRIEGKEAIECVIDVFESTGACVATLAVDDAKSHHAWFNSEIGTLTVAMAPGRFRSFDVASGTSIGADIQYGGDFSVAEFSADGRFLALGYEDGRLLLCKPLQLPPRIAPPTKMDPEKLHKLWVTLAEPDPKAAFQARWLLSAASKQTISLFQEKLRKVMGPDAKQLGDWIAQLDSKSFKERELATRELALVGDFVVAELQTALKQNIPLEPRQRIDQILKKLAVPPTGDTLRNLRSIVILESIGNDDAKAILRDLAGGAAGSRVTETAQAALARLDVAKE